MTIPLKIVQAQLNFHVGNINANLDKHIEALSKAKHDHSDIIIFPELSLTGYPPEDLLLRRDFIFAADEALKKLISHTQNIYCLVGHPYLHNNKLFNACSLIYNGQLLGTYCKQKLPDYGVFDECRYFTKGITPAIFNIKNIPCGILICEDAWTPGCINQTVLAGAKIIFILNASPFESDKHERRVATLTSLAKENSIPIVYTNTMGGQDELVFDGGSMIINQKGELCRLAPFFTEKLLTTDLTNLSSQTISVPSQEERMYQALVLGTKDYVEKNNFSTVLLGLSGGIDSALTLLIACDAVGKDRVKAIFMPSAFTSEISFEDTKMLCQNCSVELITIPIETVYEAFLQTLQPSFAHTKPDITEENIQARCRAILLMALSNKFGALVLTTGNRSELAMGYCTLYGDMAGGFAVLKDVTKTEVYSLARLRNQKRPLIPERILKRAPTAELAPNQKDEDTLPPYEILDKILELYLNKEQSIDEIVAQGFNREIVEKIVNHIRKNEYKRRQVAVGPRINNKSFGRDRRYPITNGFKG